MSKKDKIYLLIFILLPIIFFYPVYFLNKIMCWLDMLYYFMPMKEICSENLKANILPLWNPYIYCGNPLLANMQTAVFYPLSVFYYVFPFDIALRIGTFLTFFIMSIFFYFFMRLNNISEEGSFFSSLIFSYNYYMLIKAVELADINVLMWIPAILFFTKKYCLQKKLYDLFFIIFTLALSFFGGHLQVFSYAYLLFILLFFYETILNNNKPMIFLKITFWVTFILLFIILIQLLPTLKFIFNSKRNIIGLGFDESSLTYLRFEQIILFFFPFLINLFPADINFYNWVSLINIGIPALIIFFIGCYTINDIKFKNYWLITFAVILFICVLGFMPFYKFVFYNFKPLQYMRYVVKINVILLFIICFFTGLGFDNLFNTKKNLKKFLNIIFIIFYFLLIVLIFLVVFKIPILKAYKKIFDPLASFQKIYEMVLYFDICLKDFSVYIIFFFITLLILYLIIIKKYFSWIIKNILILLSFLFLISFFITLNNPYINYANLKKETQIISEINKTYNMQNKRILSPFIIDPFKESIEFKNEDEFALYYLETLYPNIPMLYKIRNVDGFDSLFLGNFHKLKLLMSYSEKPWDNHLFSLFSSEYIIAKRELKGENIILKNKRVSYLYQNKNFLDFAFFVPYYTKILFIDENDKEYKRKLEKKFNPLLNLVFYSKDKSYIEKLIKDSKKENKINNVLYVKQKNINNYEINVKNETPGFLILTDNYYPGWTAYINGKKTKILTAFLTFKCVFLDKGENKINFIFDDTTLTAGAILSLIIIFILLFFRLFYNRFLI